jgi:hypothetical protein
MARQSNSVAETALHNEIRTNLRLADATSPSGSLGRLLKGTGVFLALGLIISISLAVAFDSSWFGWKLCFLTFLLIVVPLLIWRERKSRESYLTEAVRTADPTRPNPAVTLVFGVPRALFAGYRGLRGQLTLTQQAVLDRATVLVLDLARADGGIPIKELMKPPENMHIFGTAVDLLDRHDCIGKSTDGRSLWLNSTYRRKFNQLRLKLSGGDE